MLYTNEWFNLLNPDMEIDTWIETGHAYLHKAILDKWASLLYLKTELCLWRPPEFRYVCIEKALKSGGQQGVSWVNRTFAHGIHAHAAMQAIGKFANGSSVKHSGKHVADGQEGIRSAVVLGFRPSCVFPLQVTVATDIHLDVFVVTKYVEEENDGFYWYRESVWSQLRQSFHHFVRCQFR